MQQIFVLYLRLLLLRSFLSNSVITALQSLSTSISTISFTNWYLTFIALSFLLRAVRARQDGRFDTNRHQPVRKRAHQGKGYRFRLPRINRCKRYPYPCPDAHSGFDIFFVRRSNRLYCKFIIFCFKSAALKRYLFLTQKKPTQTSTNILICLCDACAGCARYVGSAPAQAGS